MAGKFEALTKRIGQYEVDAENAATVKGLFISLIGAANSRDDLDEVVLLEQYAQLEEYSKELHDEVEDAWLAKNSEYEEPEKFKPGKKESKTPKKKAPKPAKEKKEVKAKEQKPKKALLTLGHENRLQKGGGSTKVSQWVEYMEREVENNVRSESWKSMLITCDISQPYSHKIRSANPSVKGLADQWMALPSYDDMNQADSAAKTPKKGK